MIFCEEYLSCGSATKAATIAGYSEKNAAKIGSQNLQKKPIKDYLDKRLKQIAKKLMINPDKIAVELSKIGFFDIRKLYNADGALKPVHEWDEGSAAAVMGVESYEEKTEAGEETIVVGVNRKVKIADKRAALVDLAKMLGYFAPERTVNKNINVNHNSAPLTAERMKEIDAELSANK